MPRKKEEIVADMAILKEPVEEKQDKQEEVSEVQEEVKEVRKVSESEKKAMQFGWKPRDEFEGDEGEWKPAKAFLEYGDMVGKIRELEKTIDALVKHNANIEETTRERVIEELKQKQRDAVEIGDIDSVHQITDKIAEMKYKPANMPPADNMPPEVREFLNRNGNWYNSTTADNAAMSAYAIKRDNELLLSHPNTTMGERLLMVENDVKKTFAHKFNNPAQERPQVVTAPSREASPSSKKTYGVSDLTPEQRRVFEAFAKIIPGYTAEKYIKQLKDQEGL